MTLTAKQQRLVDDYLVDLNATQVAARAPGWSSVKLESHAYPATPIDVTSHLQNELLLCIGITPRTTSGRGGHMTGSTPATRVERSLAPAMQVYSANIDYPHEVPDIYVDALSGAEQNLTLSVS